MEDKIKKLLQDSDVLLGIYGASFEDIPQYQMFIRCLSDQTLLEDGELDSFVLQNPSDPDAAYRVKAGKTDVQEEKSVLVTDDGYSGGDNVVLAAEKNIQLVTTTLTGKDAPDALVDFEYKEAGTRVIKCAADYTPKSCSYTQSTKHCKVSFQLE